MHYHPVSRPRCEDDRRYVQGYVTSSSLRDEARFCSVPPCPSPAPYPYPPNRSPAVPESAASPIFEASSPCLASPSRSLVPSPSPSLSPFPPSPLAFFRGYHSSSTHLLAWTHTQQQYPSTPHIRSSNVPSVVCKLTRQIQAPARCSVDVVPWVIDGLAPDRPSVSTYSRSMDARTTRWIERSKPVSVAPPDLPCPVHPSPPSYTPTSL